LSIGQDKVVVTPLQMAVMTSAIANGGKVFWPRLVAGWETLDPILGKQVESTPKGRLRAQLSATSGNLAILQHAMLQDVEHPAGSGAPCRIPGYLVAGKTGTAETERRLDGRKIKETWFVSYAPHDHPRYAVVVLVDDGISGGTSCAPLARKMYQTLKELPEPQPIVPRRQKWSFDPHERAL
jgi:cell division protein FtsI/penicillin-binding protein 2